MIYMLNYRDINLSLQPTLDILITCYEINIFIKEIYQNIYDSSTYSFYQHFLAHIKK